MVAPTANGFLRRRIVAVLVLFILAIYGFEAHARRREKATPATLGDQGAYLGYARHLYESNYSVVEDRNRMPIFPFLLSLIYRPGMTEAEFLVRAQVFTVNLSVVLLFLLFLIFRRFFPPLHAVALMTATAFGVFLYRVDRAQVEVLYYFVSFCAFVLLLRMFVKPGWWLAILAGAVTGAAHLTKASILPALVAWGVVFFVQTLWSFRTNPWRRLGTMALVIATFLAVVFPYIRTSKQIYGSYFYNVNSTFVMWADSSTEGFEFVKAHAIKDEWRALPPEQLPSPQKYWREHSVGQIARRIIDGSLNLMTQNALVIGYYKFVLAMLTAGLLLAWRHSARVREVVPENAGAAGFCLLFFAGYLLLYAWYDKIINDSRFVLSIFLPFIFVASVVALRLARDRVVSIAGRSIPFDRFFATFFLSLAVIDVVYNARAMFR